MSSQATPAPEPSPPKEVPPVTDAYRKAHKSYVLASGLLASWELIGITLDTKEKWGVELKSPTGVPLILVTLVFYSGYKMVIEWLQCDRDRRGNKVARLDFTMAHTVAIVAIGIFVVQYLAKAQILNLVGPALSPEQRSSAEHILFLGVIVSLALAVGGLIAWRDFGPARRTVTVLSFPLSLYLILAYLGTVAEHGAYSIPIAVVLGVGLGLLSRLLLSRTHAPN